MPRPPTPRQAIVAFDQAVAARDEAAARARSAVWEGHGGTPAQLFAYATGSDLRLASRANIAQPGRAIVAVVAQQNGEIADRLWVLTTRDGGDWKVAGFTRDPHVAALQLDGILAPGQVLEDLPESPEAAAYLRGLLDPATGVPAVRAEAPPGAVVADARQVPERGRHVVELRAPSGRAWAILDRAEKGFTFQGISSFTQLENIFARLAPSPSEPAPTGTGPDEVVMAFGAAVRARDASAARALCTSEGWGSPGDCARRLFEQCVRKELEATVVGVAAIEGERAAVQLVLTRRPATPVSRLWALMHRTGEGWRLEGVTRVGEQAGLFLDGVLPAITSWKRLPGSDVAAAWGDEALRRLQAGEAIPGDPRAVERIRTLATRPGVVVEPSGTVGVEAVGRSAVGYRFVSGTEVEPIWMLLEQAPDEGLRLRAVSMFPQLEALLAGARAAPHPKPDARDLLQATVREALRQMRIQLDAQGAPEGTGLSREDLRVRLARAFRELGVPVGANGVPEFDRANPADVRAMLTLLGAALDRVVKASGATEARSNRTSEE